MIFSYGFLESDRTEAKQVFLDMPMPDDDPLAIAKHIICRETPGIRVTTGQGTFQSSQQTTWDSPIVWWACVNEEDGLEIGVTQTTEGTRELEATWKGEQIQSSTQLRDVLAADQAWEIFQLRAVVLVLERLETQLSLLHGTSEVLNNLREQETHFHNLFRPDVFTLICQLRKLEAEFLERAVNDLMKQVSILMNSNRSTKRRHDLHDLLTNGSQKNELIASNTVTAYLAKQSEAEEMEDFS